jgi:WD40 repeat protein
MPIINYCQRIRSDITAFKELPNNSFAFSTLYHGAKIIATQECNTKASYKDKELNFHTTATCFSPDGKYIAFATNKYIYIVNMLEKKLIRNIYIDEQDLTIIRFDPTSQYIVAGNKDGRVLLYKYNSNAQLSRLCSFPLQSINTKNKKNFVSSIVFYKNLMAVSGYGGAIFIIDIYSGVKKTTLLHRTTTKTTLHFLDENHLISGDSDGRLELLSIPKNRVLKNINLPFAKPAQIISIPKTKYLIIHAKTQNMLILDSMEYKIINNNYLKFEDKIDKAIAISDTTLMVCLNNKNILHIKLHSRETLKSLILHNSLKEAYELIEEEPTLINTLEHISLERMYNKAYLDSANALVNQNISLAKQLMDRYKDVSSKQESIKLLFKSFDNYSRFKNLYLEKKYALAYAMSSKYPALKTTKQYELMEIRWKEVFTNAQRHILHNKPDFAKALFSEYITVSSKRPMIQLILKHNELFIDFLKALEKQDFKRVNEISRINELFTKMPIYKTLDSDIEKIIHKIESYIKRDKINQAKEELLKIEGAPEFLDEVTRLNIMCENMQKLQRAYKMEDFYLCYELIDNYPHLCYTQLGTFLQKHYSKLISECEEYASKGNIQSIKAVLGDLITLDARKDRVGNLLRVAFQVQIKYFLSKKKFRSAQSVIYSYIDIFTKDIEITSLMKRYEALSQKKLAITQVDTSSKTRSSWLYSTIITE